MLIRIAIASAIVLCVIGYAVGSGLWVNTGGGWYQSLQQPAWQPPPWVFGLIWPYNFLMLIITGIAMAVSAPIDKAWAYLGCLAVTVALALAWAYLFYVPHQLGAAAICLTATALLTIPIIVLCFSERAWLGVVLIPYQVWLFLAACLSWAYAANAGASSST